MKTIGLIGGTSWESTLVYYRLLNEGVRARLGGLHSAPIRLASLDFAPLAEAMSDDRWHVVAREMTGAARHLEAAGADCIALCSNTIHKVAEAVSSATTLPLVHIIDVTGRALVAQRSVRPLLLATRYTMEQDFYRLRLERHFGIEARTPAKPERDALQAIIFDELCRGIVRGPSKAAVLAMIAAAATEGCDGVIFGCTEIGLLIAQADISLPVFDTTVLHCDAILDVATGSLPLSTSTAA